MSLLVMDSGGAVRHAERTMSGRERTRAEDDLHVTLDISTPRSTTRPRDPLDDLTTTSTVRLARRADRLRRRDVSQFERLAQDHDVAPRRLRLLADAWAEAGRQGIEALGPAVPVDQGLMERAGDVIETWRRRHFPLDALRVDVWRNRLTVWWMRPTDDPTGSLDPHPLMQLRRTADGRWHLYRRAVQGEWWPVVVRGRRHRQSLSACLDAVRADTLHHFWGAQGPPDDLAVGDGMPDWPLG